jgi:hypothetical protein
LSGDLAWPEILSFLFGLVSIIAAAAALFFTRRASRAAAKRYEQIQWLLERQQRLEYLAKHPEDVTEQDISDLHLDRPSML